MKGVASIALLIFLCCNRLGAQVGLDEYLQTARQNSPLLSDLHNQAILIGLDSLITEKNYSPRVALNSTDYLAPIVNGWGYDDIITNTGQFNALLTITQEISGNKKKSVVRDIYELQKKYTEHTSRITEQELNKTITDQYIQAYSGFARWNDAKNIWITLQREDSLLYKLTDQGGFKQTDYLTFHITVLQQKLVVEQEAFDFKNDLAALNLLCGIDDTSATILLDPDLQIPSAETFASTPYYAKFTNDSITLQRQLDLLSFNYKPQLNVYADAGYNSTFKYESYKNFGASVGLTLTVPIYDGGIKNIQQDQIRVQQSTITGYRTFAEKQYDAGTRQLFLAIERTEKLQSEIENQIKYLKALMDANKINLANGDISIADYMLTVNNYISADIQLTQNKIIRYQLINQLTYFNLP